MVYNERLNGRVDADVWNGTQTTQRFFITQDLDFSDIRRYAPGTHAGLLLVRLARPGRNRLLERVSHMFETEKVEEWTGCLVVVTDQKLRTDDRHGRTADHVDD